MLGSEGRYAISGKIKIFRRYKAALLGK